MLNRHVADCSYILRILPLLACLKIILVCLKNSVTVDTENFNVRGVLLFDICLTMHHDINNIDNKLDATITVY